MRRNPRRSSHAETEKHHDPPLHGPLVLGQADRVRDFRSVSRVAFLLDHHERLQEHQGRRVHAGELPAFLHQEILLRRALEQHRHLPRPDALLRRPRRTDGLSHDALQRLGQKALARAGDPVPDEPPVPGRLRLDHALRPLGLRHHFPCQLRHHDPDHLRLRRHQHRARPEALPLHLHVYLRRHGEY